MRINKLQKIKIENISFYSKIHHYMDIKYKNKKIKKMKILECLFIFFYEF